MFAITDNAYAKVFQVVAVSAAVKILVAVPLLTIHDCPSQSTCPAGRTTEQS